MNTETDAFIENDRTTTIGIHENCPNRRYVGGTSQYVCECSSAKIVDFVNANQGHYKAAKTEDLPVL